MTLRTVIAVLLTLAFATSLGAADAKEKKNKKDAAKAEGKDTSTPHVDVIFPAGAQRGATLDVLVTGLHLATATEVRVSGDGVTAKLGGLADSGPEKSDSARQRVETGQPVEKKDTLKLTLTVAAGAELGTRDVRIITPGGVSNRYRFTVGQLREIAKVRPNTKPAIAQALGELPVLVNGQIVGGEADYYRFSAKAGRTVVCELDGRKLLPYIPDAVPGWLQAVLTLYDADGRPIASDDSFRTDPDPVLIFKAPKDGEYLLEVRDAIYRGREDFVYRLSVGELPFITDLSPTGGARGTTTRVKLTGVNLDKAEIDVPLAADAPAVTLVGTTSGGLATNLKPFAAGDFPESGEVEENDLPAKATRLKAPCTVNGRIDKPGDADYFVFSAGAKETLVLEIAARKLDSPLDSLLVLFNDKGQELARNDDAPDETAPLVTHPADSQLVYAFPAAGDYLVRVTDTQGKGGGEFAYRLTVRAPKPDFSLRIAPDNVRIAPGDTAVLTAMALRRDGFDGVIGLSVDGLPKGFSARGGVIPAKETEARFTVTAPEDAPVELVMPAVTGTAEIDGKPVAHRAAPSEEVMQAFSYIHRVPTQEMLMAVVKPSAFTVNTDLAADKVVEIPQGGEAEVSVSCRREEDTKGVIRLAADKPPRGVNVSASAIAAGDTKASVKIHATGAVGTETTVVLTGALTDGKNTITRFAPIVPVRIVAWRPPELADAEGLEMQGGWSVDVMWSRAAKLTTTPDRARGRVLETTCENDEPKKLAVILLQHMDLSKFGRVEMFVAHTSDKPIQVAVEFGAGSDWKMHETPSVEVAPGKDFTKISFRLDGADFKSEASGWKHDQKMPAGGVVDKMILVVDGLSKDVVVKFDGIKFAPAAP